MTRESFIFFANNGGFGGSYNLNEAINLHSKKYKSRLIVQGEAPYNFGNGIMTSDFNKVDSIISSANNFFICDYQGLIPICYYLTKKYKRKITHSPGDKEGVRFLIDYLKDRNVIFYWSGSKYRANNKIVNGWRNKIGSKTTFAMLDLLRCDAKAIPLMQPFDINVSNKKFDKFTLCHSPGLKHVYKEGHKEGKGTYAVERTFRKMKKKYGINYHILKGVPFKESLRIKQKSHIFVDQLAPFVGGIGKSALESLIIGTPVLSDMHNCVLAGPYADCPVVNVESEKELFKALEELYLSEERRRKLSEKGMAWSSILSFENTAGYLDEKIVW